MKKEELKEFAAYVKATLAECYDDIVENPTLKTPGCLKRVEELYSDLQDFTPETNEDKELADNLGTVLDGFISQFQTTLAMFLNFENLDLIFTDDEVFGGEFYDTLEI